MRETHNEMKHFPTNIFGFSNILNQFISYFIHYSNLRDVVTGMIKKERKDP